MVASAAPANNSTDTAAIAIQNQTTNGTTVTVANATLPEGGFISVHNQSYLPPENQSVGSVIGASSYLEPGQHEDVEVVLQQPLSENQTVVARAARDGNDNQSFDYVASQGFLDTAYSRNGTGSAVDDSASVEVENATSLAEQASVTFTNQSGNGENVTVRSVTLPDGGFVGIHETSYLPPKNKTQASLLGNSTYLTPGTHHNVTISLNRTLDDERTLLASPYRDTNGNETFEYVRSEGENDTAYAPPGSTAIIAQANVTVASNGSTQQTTGNVTETDDTGDETSIAGLFQFVEIGAIVFLFVVGYLYLRWT